MIYNKCINLLVHKVIKQFLRIYINKVYKMFNLKIKLVNEIPLKKYFKIMNILIKIIIYHSKKYNLFQIIINYKLLN